MLLSGSGPFLHPLPNPQLRLQDVNSTPNAMGSSLEKAKDMNAWASDSGGTKRERVKVWTKETRMKTGNGGGQRRDTGDIGCMIVGRER